MIIERTRNAKRNILFGTIEKFVNILLPFVSRTVLIYVLGEKYLGLGSLFSSVLSFLSLAELGFGTALVYSMYEPIAVDDTEEICALLNVYRKIYRIIGVVIAFLGLSIAPFIKLIIKADCPENINIYILYSIYLANVVISYWMYAYKQSILIAFQRNDIISKIATVINVISSIFQIAVLVIFKNYYVFVILCPVFTIISNILNSKIVDKIYPEYKCRGTVNKDVVNSIKKKVIALFGAKANSVVMHAADNIVISSFIGLSMVGIYGNYYYVMNSVTGVLTIIYTSLTAGIGNSLLKENNDKNYEDFLFLNFANSWLVCFCSASLICFYQPFMNLWVGEKMMLDTKLVVLLVIYFTIYNIRRIGLTYKDAKGVWWEDRFRPYVMLVVNLMGNIILVQIIGIYGVVLSTIISMLIALPWEVYTIYKYIFDKPLKNYYKLLSLYFLAIVVITATTYYICCLLPCGIWGLLERMVICILVPNIFFIIFFRSKAEYKRCIKLLLK